MRRLRFSKAQPAVLRGGELVCCRCSLPAPAVGISTGPLTPAGHRHHMLAAGCSQGERGPLERTCSRGETIHAARKKKPGQHLHPLEISGAFSEMKFPVDVKTWFHPFRSEKFRRENKGFAWEDKYCEATSGWGEGPREMPICIISQPELLFSRAAEREKHNRWCRCALTDTPSCRRCIIHRRRVCLLPKKNSWDYLLLPRLCAKTHQLYSRRGHSNKHGPRIQPKLLRAALDLLVPQPDTPSPTSWKSGCGGGVAGGGGVWNGNE